MADLRSTQTRRHWAAGLAAAVLLSLLLTPVQAGSDHSNQGTVKVQDDSDTGSNSNNPHVGCGFSVEGFGMAASNGTITVKAWPPSGDHDTVVLASTWTMDNTTGHDANHFVAGPYQLPSGHYKVFASNAPGHDKTKVFWVDCQAEVPMFPSMTALGLASIVGVGGSWAFLRRK